MTERSSNLNWGMRYSLMTVTIILLVTSVSYSEVDPSVVILDIKERPSAVYYAIPTSYDDDYCFMAAEATYGINARVLWSISRHESGHNPIAVNKNKNGTIDYCHMQINSGWQRVIGRENWRRLSNKCYCTMVGAWILSHCIRNHGYNWVAIGCYNSPNRERGTSYAQKISAILRRIERGEGHEKRRS